jgi:hypothetical protein
MPFTESLVGSEAWQLPPSRCLQTESTAAAESRRAVRQRAQRTNGVCLEMREIGRRNAVDLSRLACPLQI